MFKNDDLIMKEDTEKLIEKLESQRLNWLSKYASKRSMYAERELAYHGITLLAWEKRFKPYVEDRDGLTPYSEFLKKCKDRDKLLSCNITTKEKTEGKPFIHNALREIVDKYTNQIANKKRIVDIDYKGNRELEFALQSFMTVYGNSATANLEIKEVIRDYLIKGKGYMRATFDTLKTNMVERLDPDYLILPPAVKKTDDAGGYYYVHRLPITTIYKNFPEIDKALKKIKADKEKEDKDNSNSYSNYSSNSKNNYSSNSNSYNAPKTGYSTNITYLANSYSTTPVKEEKNKGGRPPINKDYNPFKYSENSCIETGSRYPYKLGEDMLTMFNEYNVNTFYSLLRETQNPLVEMYNGDYSTLGIGNYLNTSHSDFNSSSLGLSLLDFGYKSNSYAFISLFGTDTVDVIEFVDLTQGRRFIYVGKYFLLSEIIDPMAYSICEIDWGYQSSLIGQELDSFKTFIHESERKIVLENLLTVNTNLINSTLLDRETLENLRIGESPFLIVGKQDITAGFQNEPNQLPLVTPLSYQNPYSEYLLQKPTSTLQSIKESTNSIEQISFQMTKEQASAELFSRNIGLDNALQSFMNQLIASFPYIILNYLMDKYDNTVFIPQLVQMEEEVTKSSIPKPKQLTTLIKDLEVTGLGNTIDIEKSYIYNQVNLIISEDYKTELLNKKTIQEAFEAATKTYIDSVKTKVLRSDEFIEQAIIIRDEIRAAQETALLADTGLNKVQPILPAPVKEEKLLGIDVSQQQVAYEANPNKEIKMPSVSVDPDHVKKVIADLFNKMVDMELQKSNFTPQTDRSIYLTKTTIKLALENAIFRIKPPATVEEKIKQMQSLSIIASNFGNPVAIDFETVLYDIASEMDLSAVVRTPEAQRQYLVNKVVGNVSLSVVATPEQAPQVLKQAFNMEVDPVQPPMQPIAGQEQQVPQQLPMEQPMQ